MRTLCFSAAGRGLNMLLYSAAWRLLDAASCLRTRSCRALASLLPSSCAPRGLGDKACRAQQQSFWARSTADREQPEQPQHLQHRAAQAAAAARFGGRSAHRTPQAHTAAHGRYLQRGPQPHCSSRAGRFPLTNTTHDPSHLLDVQEEELTCKSTALTSCCASMK